MAVIDSGAPALGNDSHKIPWETVAMLVDKSCLFGFGSVGKPKGTVKVDATRNGHIDGVFALTATDPITFKASSEATLGTTWEGSGITVYQWKQGAWSRIGIPAIERDGNEIRFPLGVGSEGLFKFTMLFPREKQSIPFEFYIIVCETWKQDLCRFCQTTKTAIEQNRDPQLIHSSIAISHLDHLLNLLNDTSFLSRAELQALSNAVRAKNAFTQGRSPDLVHRGLTRLLLRRFPGAETVEFTLHVPREYDPCQKWPLYMNTDAYKVTDGHKGMIDLWCHAMSINELRWKEYRIVKAILHENLSIDDDRVYLGGACRAGLPAMGLALQHPDEWAEVDIDLGNSFNHLSGNAVNLNMNFVQFSHKGVDLFDQWYDFGLKCLQYYGCHVSTTPTTNTFSSLSQASPQAVRLQKPRRVFFTSDSLKAAKAYWVEITGRSDENLMGTIDASVDGQTVLVKTVNVDSYNLDIARAPVNQNEPVRIVENGDALATVLRGPFLKRPAKYHNKPRIKNERVCGPIMDAFTEPYVVVYGGGGTDTALNAWSKSIGECLAKGAPVFSDDGVPSRLMTSHNVILIGTPASNRWIAKMNRELPVQVDRGQIVSNGRRYARDSGFCLIYPNPLNPCHYAAAFSATTANAMSQVMKVYDQLKSMSPADVVIFEMTQNHEIQWRVAEAFDTVWGWHETWKQTLATTRKKHPKWQWQQWVAHVVKRELDTQAVILEDPHRLPGAVLEDQITVRDLFNAFDNLWILKVQLDGKALKQLMMMPFTDISKKPDVPLVVEGIRYASTKTGHGSLIDIDGLKDHQKYTLALPSQWVSWNHLNIDLGNYRMVGCDYMINMLKRYLLRRTDLDLDTELDTMTYNVF